MDPVVYKSAGAVFNILTGSSPSYTRTADAGITKIGQPKMSAKDIDTTELVNTDGFTTSIAGFREAGEIDIEGHLLMPGGSSDSQTAIFTNFLNGSSMMFEVATVNGAKLDGNGYVKGFEFGELTTDGLQTFKAALKISGKPTYTPPA